jgi:hypothetical protein
MYSGTIFINPVIQFASFHLDNGITPTARTDSFSFAIVVFASVFTPV